MEEEFNLKEKRKEVDRKLVESNLDMFTIKIIHDLIKKQDDEFIKRQFQIIEELLSVKDAMRIEKEFKELSGFFEGEKK